MNADEHQKEQEEHRRWLEEWGNQRSSQNELTKILRDNYECQVCKSKNKLNAH